MKFRVMFKTPDAVEYAIGGELVHAFSYVNADDPDAIRECREQLRADLQKVTDKYVSYGETITVEFDTETGTAIVVPKSK